MAPPRARRAAPGAVCDARAMKVGFTLQPDEHYLELCEELILEEVDCYEVTPETLWRRTPEGAIEPNGFHRLFADLRARTGRPFVAHGVAYSPGSFGPSEERRRERWRASLAATHERFEFAWMTDHLGASTLAGSNVALPLPLPPTPEFAARVRASLIELQGVAPRVGVENSAFYFALGDPLDEPDFLRQALDAPDLVLLLDLHNLHTNAENLGFDPHAWLARAPLERVLELHLSGGSTSDPAWLGGESRRLDSHDHAVPEPVWSLFEAVLPRLANLEAVVLERMEGTVQPEDVEPLRGELRRIRELLGARS